VLRPLDISAHAELHDPFEKCIVVLGSDIGWWQFTGFFSCL